MSNPAVVAAYRRALQKNGVDIIVTRVNGVAPNAVTFSVNVTAIVRDYQPDSTVVSEAGYSAGKQGAITQGDRMLIVMADDLGAQNFPLPMRKHDRITLPTGDVLDVVEVDALKRVTAGAIELKAAGVS